MIGEKILNYKIEKLIGEGGMGTVYLGINEQFEQKVAIKVLAPQFVHNADIVKRFKKEASMLSKLNHPNIVKLLNFYENDNGVYLIMEYVEGYTLDEYIIKISGPILEQKAIKMFYDILDGFEFAHNKGIIHRDIKPSNIIVTNDGEIKIFDFGIAKLINEPENLRLTRTGTKLGTVTYMSPEQIQQGEISKLSDIYSLGVVLHQVLTGVSPYNPNNMSEFNISTKIVYEPLPRLKSIYPHVSDEIQIIIDKATSKDPNKRYKTCGVFRNELLNLLNEKNTISKNIINTSSKTVVDKRYLNKTQEYSTDSDIIHSDKKKLIIELNNIKSQIESIITIRDEGLISDNDINNKLLSLKNQEILLQRKINSIENDKLIEDFIYKNNKSIINKLETLLKSDIINQNEFDSKINQLILKKKKEIQNFSFSELKYSELAKFHKQALIKYVNSENIKRTFLLSKNNDTKFKVLNDLKLQKLILEGKGDDYYLVILPKELKMIK